MGDSMNQLIFEQPNLHRAPSLYARADLHKVLSALLQALLPDAGFIESHKYEDIRMIFSVIFALLTAGVISFFQYPAYDMEIFIFGCVGLLIFGILTLLEVWYIGYDTIMSLETSCGGILRIQMQLPESSPKLTWQLWSDKDGKVSGYAKKPTTKEFCVSRYFDVDGYCVHEKLFDDVCGLIEQHTGELNVEKNKQD